jgi:uncharacterized protein YtpQ (UPF0354 family)
LNQEAIKDKVKVELQKAIQEFWVIVEKEHNVLEIKHTINSDKGLTVRLDDLFRKVEEEPKEENKWITDLVLRVKATLKATEAEQKLVGREGRIFPVLRHPSTAKSTGDGIPLITREHTAESVIYYALDLGTSYVLIHQNHLREAGWSEGKLHELAIYNLSRLDSTPKVDRVGENEFYFISRGDGYSASRVLNPKLLEWMERKVTGTLGVSFPHQDVLVFADLQDKKGYQVLSQISMDFSIKGDIPISSIPYVYENGELEPYMTISTSTKGSRVRQPIMGKKKK